ncbi:hypothetical protein [Undibacterium fentianense]|uniref:Uncharacterized protein n=1 Tax=Undibacterium fentianense TaxID=2828728 RepID=A0A941E0N8_9BURK|nr:hypothetical protein [Undibacterium fentianense]MBR7799102.1 hypothetical protein [Undibacterium fentianense]
MLTTDQINQTLRPALSNLKQEMLQLNTPIEVEARLLAAFSQQFPSKPWWKRWWREPSQLAGLTVIASLVLMLILADPMSLTGRSVSPMHNDSDVSRSDLGDYEEIPFIALNSGEAILKQGTMRIVETEVPQSFLASYGVSVSPQTAGEYARAEVLIGEDDEYLAVRFVPSE